MFMRQVSFSLPPRPAAASGHGLVFLLAGLALATVSGLVAAPVVGPIEDNDTVALQVSGSTGTLQLTMARAPASAEGATLRAINRDDYSLWSAPLTRRGNQWTAPIDREALEAILMVDRLRAEFPGAARDNEALHLVIPRDRFLPALETAAPLAGREPLFFTPPEAPERPEIPAANVDRLHAESFAMLARVWDHQIAAHQHQFAAARSRAHSYFLDLRAAGRLPWPQEALEGVAQSYEALKQREEQIARTRQEWREAAQNFAREWSSAHANDAPLTINFGEAT